MLYQGYQDDAHLDNTTKQKGKRLQLSDEQREVLDAVYAVETVPSPPLREKLSASLDLTSRQIQVWFQNRRQRSKSKEPKPARVTLQSSDQILDALFEFSDDVSPSTRAKLALEAINKVKRKVAVEAGGQQAHLSGFSAVAAQRPPAASSSGDLPPNLSFDWGLPLIRASFTNLVELADVPVVDMLCDYVGDSVMPNGSPPTSCRTGYDVGSGAASATTAEAPPPPQPPPPVLQALLAFACHAMSLGAVEYFERCASYNTPSAQHVLKQSYRRPGGSCSAQTLERCRVPLATVIAERVCQLSDMVFYGDAEPHAVALSRSGIPLRSIVGVPCFYSVDVGDQPPQRSDTRSVSGVLILYSSNRLVRLAPVNSFLSLLSSSITLGVLAEQQQPQFGGGDDGDAATTASSVRKYTPHARMEATGTHSWMLLAAARSLRADIAEDWRAEGSSSGVSLAHERLLVSSSVDASRVVLDLGADVEQAHRFSSQMCRASLFAGKTVWCNATHSSGVLEGVALPMQTAVGVPMAATMRPNAPAETTESSAHVFVFYTLRRLEQSKATSSLLSLIQLLLAGCDSLRAAGIAVDPDAATATAASSAAAASEQPPSAASTEATSSQRCAAASYAAAAGGSPEGTAPCVAPMTRGDGSRSTSSSTPDLGTFQSNSWDELSTEQVLSLIDRCLKDEKDPKRSPGDDSTSDSSVASSSSAAAKHVPSNSAAAFLAEQGVSQKFSLAAVANSAQLPRPAAVHPAAAANDEAAADVDAADDDAADVDAADDAAPKPRSGGIPKRSLSGAQLDGVPLKRSGCSDNLDSLSL